MWFEPVTELTIVIVGDPGVPNKERIILRPTQTIDLGQFSMTVGIRDKDNPNLVVPLQDHLFWFPNLVIEPPSWIFLYTGKGTYEKTNLAGTSETAHVFHWGREIVLFTYFELVPVLFKQTAMLIGPNPDRPRFPQLPSLPPRPPGLPLANLPRIRRPGT